MSGTEFLSKCTACGGNWSAMLMSGIKECFPEQYKNLSDDKSYDLMELLQITTACGVKWEG
jgi:hypothetical protein